MSSHLTVRLAAVASGTILGLMSVVTPAAAATKTQKDAAGDVDVFEPAPVNEKSDIRSVTVTATKKTIKVIVKVKDLVPDSDSEN